jgi:hypothetical protein
VPKNVARTHAGRLRTEKKNRYQYADPVTHHCLLRASRITRR